MSTPTGFVNAHTHLELGMLAALCPDGQPFVEWLLGMLPLRAGITPADYQRAIEAGIAALVEAGTVAVGDISSTGWSVEPLLQSVREHCYTRTRYVSPLPPVAESGEFYPPSPVEVQIGGATIFVLRAEDLARL